MTSDTLATCSNQTTYRGRGGADRVISAPQNYSPKMHAYSMASLLFLLFSFFFYIAEKKKKKKRYAVGPSTGGRY